MLFRSLEVVYVHHHQAGGVAIAERQPEGIFQVVEPVAAGRELGQVVHGGEFVKAHVFNCDCGLAGENFQQFGIHGGIERKLDKNDAHYAVAR